MSQYSQIYIIYTKEGKSYLIARHYNWNYDERMISRCRYALKWIKKVIDCDLYFTTEPEKLQRILDTNFDMINVQIGCDIIKEYQEQFSEDDFNEYVFKMQPNNDGKLFIDIKKGIVKYIFLDDNCDTNKLMSARQYMDWDYEDWKENKHIEERQKILCEENLHELEKYAITMTKGEVEEFLNCNYINNLK